MPRFMIDARHNFHKIFMLHLKKKKPQKQKTKNKNYTWYILDLFYHFYAALSVLVTLDA